MGDHEWRIHAASMDERFTSFMKRFDDYIAEQREARKVQTAELARLNSMFFNFLKWCSVSFLSLSVYLLIFGPPWK